MSERSDLLMDRVLCSTRPKHLATNEALAELIIDYINKNLTLGDQVRIVFNKKHLNIKLVVNEQDEHYLINNFDAGSYSPQVVGRMVDEAICVKEIDDCDR
jgi:hypothetical protein